MFFYLQETLENPISIMSWYFIQESERRSTSNMYEYMFNRFHWAIRKWFGVFILTLKLHCSKPNKYVPSRNQILFTIINVVTRSQGANFSVSATPSVCHFWPDLPPPRARGPVLVWVTTSMAHRVTLDCTHLISQDSYKSVDMITHHHWLPIKNNNNPIMPECFQFSKQVHKPKKKWKPDPWSVLPESYPKSPVFLDFCWPSAAPELCRNLSPHLPHWPAKICSSIANKRQVE